MVRKYDFFRMESGLVAMMWRGGGKCKWNAEGRIRFCQVVWYNSVLAFSGSLSDHGQISPIAAFFRHISGFCRKEVRRKQLHCRAVSTRIQLSGAGQHCVGTGFALGRTPRINAFYFQKKSFKEENQCHDSRSLWQVVPLHCLSLP